MKQFMLFKIAKMELLVMGYNICSLETKHRDEQHDAIAIEHWDLDKMMMVYKEYTGNGLNLCSYNIDTSDQREKTNMLLIVVSYKWIGKVLVRAEVEANFILLMNQWC